MGAMNEINAMSKSELAAVPQDDGDDKLIAQFQADVATAKHNIGKKAEVKRTKSKVEQEAEAALADPETKKELVANAAQAEVDLNSAVPSAMSLLQEGPTDGADELGESEDEGDADQFHLMGGDEATWPRPSTTRSHRRCRASWEASKQILA